MRTAPFAAEWRAKVEALADEALTQEVVACVRAGLTRTDALGMTRLERHAFLTAYAEQEQDAYERSQEQSG